MKEVYTRRGERITVDDDDYLKVSRYTWRLDNDGYAWASIWQSGEKKCRSVRMHRFIIDAPGQWQVDHIDHDKQNNQQANLRLCTPSENEHNKPRKQMGTSRFRGVNLDKSSGKWEVRIRINGVRWRLGYFTDEEVAAKAYDAVAYDHYGLLSSLNFGSPSEL